MDRRKSRGGKSQRKKREDQRRERVRRKKMQVREKVEKSRHTVFYQWFVAPVAKAAGAEPPGRMRDENCTPLWREAHFEVKKLKAPHVRNTFGS